MRRHAQIVKSQKRLAGDAVCSQLMEDYRGQDCSHRIVRNWKLGCDALKTVASMKIELFFELFASEKQDSLGPLSACEVSRRPGPRAIIKTRDNSNLRPKPSPRLRVHKKASPS